MNRNSGTYRGVCGEWSGVDLLLLEHQDRTPLKLAITAAIMFHLILFWWNIWPEGTPLPLPVRDEGPFIVKQYKPKPIEPVKQPIQEKKTMKIPIPDPTPHEIEPVFEAVPNLEPPPLADSGVIFGDQEFEPPADAPPYATAPIPEYLVTSPPVILKRVKPKYPRLAKISGVEGLVILEAIFQKDGSVGQVTVLKTPAGKLGFDREAVTALRKWEFKPGEMDGRPVDVIMTLTVRFKLDR